jgi:amidase
MKSGFEVMVWVLERPPSESPLATGDGESARGGATIVASRRFETAQVTSPFVPGPPLRIAGAPSGPLVGLTFAAKDLFDVAGHPTGGGNPDWARRHPVPTRHAWAVQRLLDAGATLIGKTITDEVSLGILGENPFDGTPLNPAAPGRVPGGSSAGSASAVAQGLCDAALGTDTGGSVRVPASFCGLYGIRPTHGRLDLTGMMPQAPSSDTAGWFARDAATFARVSEVLLGETIPTTLPTRLIVGVDAFGLADPDTAAALQPMVRRLSDLMKEVREDVLAPPGMSVWARAQRTLQPYEAWLTFREWIDRDNPRLAFGVARMLVAASAIPESERQWAAMMRVEARARLAWLLPSDTILCLPTTPFPAPAQGLSLTALEPVRARILCLAAHGGLTGVPEVSLPGATVDGLPVGLSVVGARGSDAALVAVAAAMEASR